VGRPLTLDTVRQARTASQQGTAPLQGSTQQNARRAGLGASRRSASRASRVPAGQRKCAAPWSELARPECVFGEFPLRITPWWFDDPERQLRSGKPRWAAAATSRDGSGVARSL